MTPKVSIFEEYEGKFVVEVIIKDINGTTFLREEAVPPFMSYRGLNDSGLYLLHFIRVPDDIPMRTPLKAYVVVKKKDEAFEEKYGPLTLRIVKMSDE